MSKLKELARGLLKKLRHSVPEETSGTSTTSTPSAKPFNRIATDITKYIYHNPGLNRSERNNLYARIKRKGIHKRATPAQVEAAAWQLRETPKNAPATRSRLLENSRLRRAGEAIKTWVRA